MRYRGSPSRVEVTPGRRWYVYALIVILLGSCLCVALLTTMVSLSGSLQ